MNEPTSMYVTASYRNGHRDITQVPNRNEAYRVHRERYESDGAETVKITDSLPKLGWLPRDSVTFRPYEPHDLISDLHLPRPIRKGQQS